MKQIGISVFALILCLVGFRIISPAADAAPEPSYHIAYLLAKNTRYENEFVRPDTLLKDLLSQGHKIDVVYSWQALLDLNAKHPLDALVLHASALPMVDFEWMANAYWQGLTISTISIYPAMIAHLFDDGCVPFGRLRVPEETPYITIGTSIILSLHDQKDIAKWYRRDWRRNCGHPKPVEVVKPTEAASRFTSGPLINEGIHEAYQFFLIDHIQSAEEQRKRFIEEHKDSEQTDNIIWLSR